MAVLVVFLLAGIILGAFSTLLVRNFANRYGLSFGPLSNRHVHTSPIPRLGGIAIFSTLLILYGAFLFAGRYGVLRRAPHPDVLKILAPGIGLFLVGLWDDLRGMRAV